MGKYGAGSPAWNKIKEVMIIRISEDPAYTEGLDMKSFTVMDLMRAATINELPPDWRAFADRCREETNGLIMED